MTARRRLAAVSGLLCTVVLAGCSDDDPEAGPSPTSSPTSSPTASPSGTPSSSATSSPTQTSASPTTSPPSPAGEVIQLVDMSFQVPEGWTVDDRFGKTEVILDDSQPGGLIYVKDDIALPNEDLEDLAGSGLEAAESTGHEPRRVKNRVVGGLDGYVLVGSSQAYEKYYEWGTRTEKSWVRVQFEWVIEPPNADQVVEQLLASITFS